MAEQLDALMVQINLLGRTLLAWHRQDDASQRLATIPGVGIITATALSATVTDPTAFRSGREFAAFLGLVPRQNSSGGKERLGRVSKMGDRYLRKLLRRGRHVGDPPGSKQHRRCGCVDPFAARATPRPRRHRGHGQQDGSDRLGRADAQRRLPRAGVTPDRQSRGRTAAPNWKGARGLMAI